MNGHSEEQPRQGTEEAAEPFAGEYEPPVRSRRTGLRIAAIVVVVAFLLAIGFGFTPILEEFQGRYFWSNRCCVCSYPGDTDRVTRTWGLSDSHHDAEALDEAKGIALDPKASKEERATAQAQIAYSAWMLGETDVASAAIADFEKDSPALKLDPDVLREAKSTQSLLAQHIAARDINPISGVDWAAANKTLQNPSFSAGLAGWREQVGGGKLTDGIDPSGFGPGKPSAYLAASGAGAHDWNWFGQDVANEKYLGKRVKLTAWLKADNIRGRVYLAMRVDTPSVNFPAYVPHGALKGTTAWQEESIVLDVPQDAQGILLGIFMGGSGKASLANVSLQVVGSDVPTTPARSEF